MPTDARLAAGLADDASLLSHTECLALRSTLLDREIGLRVRTHYHDFRAFPNVFTGLELTRWLVNHDIVIDLNGATLVGAQLVKMNYITVVADSAGASALFSGTQAALYSFVSVVCGLSRHRREARLGNAGPKMFSKSKWQGFLGSNTRQKRSLKQRIRTMSRLFPAKAKSKPRTNTKIDVNTARNVELEKLAKGKTALQRAVDEGFDYREVMVPTYVPIFATSEGSVLRKAPADGDTGTPTSYHFHYNMHVVRKSDSREVATIRPRKSNTAKQGQCLFYMMGETDRVRHAYLDSVKG
jgi:hypothetical protein